MPPTTTTPTLPEITRRVRTVPGARHAQSPNLPDYLLFMLPLTIWEQRNLSDAEVRQIQERSTNAIASHGDDLQFGGRHAREALRGLVEGMAILARAPGGVTFAGVHACLQDHPKCPA